MTVILCCGSWSVKSRQVANIKVTNLKLFLFAILIIGAGLFPAVAQAQEPVTAYAPGQILVKFKPQVGTVRGMGALQAEGLPILELSARSGLLRVEVEPGREAERIAELAARDDVQYATYNYRVHAMGDPNDPGYSGAQWAPQIMTAPHAWDIHTGSNNITLAILDSGIDLDHPDLQANIVPGFDFINNDSVADDDLGHGTHVAGIAAAVGNNSLGIAGISWKGQLMPLKVLDAYGQGWVDDVVEAIYYAVDHGADIINMSLGTEGTRWPCYWEGMEEAFDYAVGQGVLVFVSAGNDGKWGVSCPGAYSQVVAVGATTSADSRASYSNYGPRLDLTAPGHEIYSTVPGGSYDYESGTSRAAPHAAGLAALLWSFVPSLTDEQLLELMQSSAVDLGAAGWDIYYGYGRVDAGNALDAVILSVPSGLNILIDNDSEGTVGSINIQTLDPTPTRSVTWSASMDPTYPWLSLSTSSGTVSGSQPTGQIGLAIDGYPASYGSYTTTVTIAGLTQAGVTINPPPVPVTISYLTELPRYYLPIVGK